MDILPTQVYEDDSFTPTQQLSQSLSHDAKAVNVQVGTLRIGSVTYPINQGITTIGRHPQCTIIVNDQTVSKKHAEIEANIEQTWICDLQSSNKTKLNGSILRHHRYYELKGISAIEFGMVRAIYSMVGEMNESMIPETPSQSRPRNQKMIIPGTPDTSMNYSSTSEGNASMVPGTQAEKEDSVFLRPSAPVRSSTSSRKSNLLESSIEVSMNDFGDCSGPGKENLGDQRVSIHDMETQKVDSQSDLRSNIHDVETQKICLSNSPVAKQVHYQTDIHEMETQRKDTNTKHNVTDIHDVETQRDESIHDLNTPRKTEVRNVSVEGGERVGVVEKGETEETSLTVNVSIEARKSENKEEKSSINAIDQLAHAVTAKNQNSPNSEQLENYPSGSQDCLELSITTNFEDECTDLDRSCNLLGSQNLLENLSNNDPSSESDSKSVSPLKRSVNNNETTDKSSDEENIFEMATQINAKAENVVEGVTGRVGHSLKPSSMEDSSDDDTDQEGVFQRYSRIATQDSSQATCTSKSQLDSDDSNTDEEGHFVAMAAKEKRLASLSFEARQDEIKETKSDAGSSRDSEDLFDIATQQVNHKDSSKGQADVSKDSVDFDTPTQVIEVNEPRDIIKKSSIDFDTPKQVIEANKPEEIADTDSIDFDTPTQVIDTNQPMNVTEKGGVNSDTQTQLIERIEPTSNAEEENSKEDEDDLLPTQILPIHEVSRNDTTKRTNVAHSRGKVEGDVDYNSPTQIIVEKASTYNEPSSNESEKSNPHLIEEFSIEDIDYEMAPTQLLSDLEEKKKAALARNRKKSRKSKQVNLDDTLEKNLNEMFDGINENIEDDLPLMSTQVLTNMLQSPPKEEEEIADVNVNKDLPGSSEEKSQVSPVIRSRKLQRSSLKNSTPNSDSQTYFSNLTTTRKRNILVDSQELSIPSKDKADDELLKKSMNKSVNDENDISVALLQSTPKNSPSIRLSRSSKEPMEVPKPVTERVELSKGKKNITAKLDMGDEVSTTLFNTNKSEVRSIVLDSDEDIMAGLPEVRISGTLSNPASPTSSTEFKLTTRNMRLKSGGKKTEAKKRGAPKKTTRKSVARTNLENNEHSRPTSTAFSRSLQNFNTSRLPETIYESSEDIMDKIKPATRTSSRKPKESRSLQTKPNPPHEEVRHSPSIQDSGRTRSSSKENVDSSSVFQVSKEALIVTKAEPVRKTTVNARRAVKRSSSSTDVPDGNVTKRRKEDVTADTSVATKGKRNAKKAAATRSNSANILNYVTRRDSPMLNTDDSQDSVNSSQESFTTKQLSIKIARLSPDTLSRSLSPFAATESARKDDRVADNRATSKSKQENDEGKTVETRETKSTRATRNRHVEDVSLQVGEESQEVEMIMNSWVKEHNVNVNGKKQEEANESTNESTNKGTKRVTRGRGARKRGYATPSTSEEIVENTSSEIYESDNACFEMPTTKAKRAKVSKSTANVDNTAANESTTKGRRNVRQSTRTTRGLQQSVVDSSLEDVKEENANESSVKNSKGKENAPKRKGKKKKVQNEETEENKDDVTIQETTSSEMNSSMDVSAISTPNRSRRTMNTSFATSSPYKIKHKILFTGITNDHSKLLTKLGSSQVEDPTKCTVLVTDKVRRTVKFLCALAQAVPIVSVSWLIDSEKIKQFAELDNYILKDPAAEAKFGFRLRGSLEKAKKQKLLDGYTIVLTPNVAPPPLPELKSIISSCGGKPLVRPPSSWPQNAVIISREEDLANAKKFLAKAPKTVTIQSTEFILTGILRQELDFVKYKLT